MSKSGFEQVIDNDITYEEFEFQINEDPVGYNHGLSEEEYKIYKRRGKVAIEELNTSRQKAEIILKWKEFFREQIVENHVKNTNKLKHLKEFNLNPFLDNYRANFLLGDNSARSKATALVYARSLGTSINTIFGGSLQKFCSEILSGFASTTSGIDIEYFDFIDKRHKYCQIKAGPNTINKDDVKTIKDHFAGVKNLARVNHLNVTFDDLVVGVFYGEPKDLSNHYQKILDEYPVYIGKEFWERLTGDDHFYEQLTIAADEVAIEYDGRTMLDEVISNLAIEIEKAENS